MRFFRARSLILSPSKKSIARLWLPSSPALKSLSGSGRCAPLAKVSFTFPLWALATAIIPSRDHTGLPIHFHSSIISRSAARMLLRTLANVLPRQSVISAISWSIRSDGFSGSLFLGINLSAPITFRSWVHPFQQVFEVGEPALPDPGHLACPVDQRGKRAELRAIMGLASFMAVAYQPGLLQNAEMF